MSATITSLTEPLMRCLSTDAEACSDVDPRHSRSSGDSHSTIQVAMRSDQGELRSGDFFQQVQSSVLGDAHSVNDTLTQGACQVELDAIRSGSQGLIR